MNPHTIFYYPYSSFTDVQTPLLKAAALYFDKLYLLDPEKATGGTIGIGKVGQEVALLEKEAILERVAPEEVLTTYDQPMAHAIWTDLNDPEFIKLCLLSGKASHWRLALAKIPKALRNEPQFAPQDRAMQWLLGELPQNLGADIGRYTEVYAEITQQFYREDFVYDEPRGAVEYRYADYPLPLGESIMVNHALFAGLLYKGATPLTDDPFHNQVLALKINRARALPEVGQILADRATKQNLLAASTLRDPQLNLPAISPQFSLEDVLEYRSKNADELGRTREQLGWLARQMEQTPWSKGFEEELDRKTIPGIAQELEKAKRARDAWLKSKRGRLALKAAGISVGAATATIALVLSPTPLLPVAVVIGMLGLVSSAAIPGLELALDWRDGKSTATENGLHYLFSIRGG